jgi:hypothetical protein
MPADLKGRAAAPQLAARVDPAAPAGDLLRPLATLLRRLRDRRKHAQAAAARPPATRDTPLTMEDARGR